MVRVPRHPLALDVLRAVRAGCSSAEAVVAHVGGDARAALRSVVHGSYGLYRHRDGQLALSTKGRELLALEGLPVVGRTCRWVERVRCAPSPPTLQLLHAIAPGPRGWPALALAGFDARAVGRVVRQGYVESTADGYSLTARGREVVATGSWTRMVERVRARRRVVGRTGGAA